jgi:H3 lysine-79-specific histone-lysine N-methyltransferase
LEHPRVLSIIEAVDAVLVNNFTFGSTLNQGLMDLFLGLKEGAKIVSLMNFAPLRKRMTDYHRQRPNAIFNVQQIHYPRDSVSWSSADGYYYVHTVDRAGLARDMELIEHQREKTAKKKRNK